MKPPWRFYPTPVRMATLKKTRTAEENVCGTLTHDW